MTSLQSLKNEKAKLRKQVLKMQKVEGEKRALEIETKKLKMEIAKSKAQLKRGIRSQLGKIARVSKRVVNSPGFKRGLRNTKRALIKFGNS